MLILGMTLPFAVCTVLLNEMYTTSVLGDFGICIVTENMVLVEMGDGLEMDSQRFFEG